MENLQQIRKDKPKDETFFAFILSSMKGAIYRRLLYKQKTHDDVWLKTTIEHLRFRVEKEFETWQSRVKIWDLELTGVLDLICQAILLYFRVQEVYLQHKDDKVECIELNTPEERAQFEKEYEKESLIRDATKGFKLSELKQTIIELDNLDLSEVNEFMNWLNSFMEK